MRSPDPEAFLRRKPILPPSVRSFILTVRLSVCKTVRLAEYLLISASDCLISSPFVRCVGSQYPTLSMSVSTENHDNPLSDAMVVNMSSLLTTSLSVIVVDKTVKQDKATVRTFYICHDI